MLHKQHAVQFCRILAFTTGLLMTISFAGTKPAASNTPSNATCHKLGALTKVAAQQRDQGLNPEQTHEKMTQLLIKDYSHDKALSRKLLLMPVALAWLGRDLNPDSLYSLGFFLCLAGHNRLLHKDDSVYLLQSAMLCQKRMKNRVKVHSCMQLAYLLLLQNKIKTLKKRTMQKKGKPPRPVKSAAPG